MNVETRQLLDLSLRMSRAWNPEQNLRAAYNVQEEAESKDWGTMRSFVLRKRGVIERCNQPLEQPTDGKLNQRLHAINTEVYVGRGEFCALYGDA